MRLCILGGMADKDFEEKHRRHRTGKFAPKPNSRQPSAAEPHRVDLTAEKQAAPPKVVRQVLDANTALEHLSPGEQGSAANRLRVMLGATFSERDDAVTIKFKGSRKYNWASIWREQDAYTIMFGSSNGKRTKLLEGVGAEKLAAAFEETTGLRTSL